MGFRNPNVFLRAIQGRPTIKRAILPRVCPPGEPAMFTFVDFVQKFLRGGERVDHNSPQPETPREDTP